MQTAIVRHERTADGSSTLISEALGVSYHSLHGAVQESQHVFIQAGLQEVAKQKSAIRLLEIGLGTGLNALLSWHYADQTQLKLDYTALEAFPISEHDVQSLDYSGFALPAKPDVIANLAWEIPHHLSEHFRFTKVLGTWPEYFGLAGFDLIYYDAFAPSAQPELWNEKALMACVNMLNQGGIWVTYCAKGEVRRTMQALGMQVERLPGPPFKRHMLRARKG